MRKVTIGKAGVILLSCTITASAFAGFGDLLKQIEDGGKQLIEQKQSTPTSSTTAGTSLDYDTVIAGLKEALEVGSRQAIESVSQENGYFNNAQIKIPLPAQLEQASGLLKKFGLGSQVEQFELSMNRAAEQAAPEATEILVTAIKEMSIEDARTILNGPDNAATEYFREKTSTRLSELFRPSVETSMNQVGVTKYYGDLTKKAEEVPMVGSMAQNYNLEDHVTEGALNGLFTMLAAEEKKIRENPAARTTDLLKQVFNF
ncbi:DUF4197 domain-containing protein [Amphritea japonica]|uniref:DUF4197 domain-containing protein n=1 Tax=Amphritea japonica ATCC BAA-1530 TaxID=1278309 RepID=A0A7R6PDQ1_9GAMM|nr:DUF4197 domain-containing protein [Amphritea japonica]BBB27171.1 conserved hypothetical protein [Amphritea japonica ATCC BAA-1530]